MGQGLGGQALVTMPFPLRFPLAFDGKLLGQVVRIFTDTIAGWHRKRHADRGLPAGESGAVTVIQRANSDLRLNPHLHTAFLDGVLCKYILRPPLANDRLTIIDDDHVRLDFKKPWSDGDGRGEAAWGRGWAGRP